jgi:hypothetical protein
MSTKNSDYMTQERVARALIRDRVRMALRLAQTYEAGSFWARLYRAEADGLAVSPATGLPSGRYSQDPAEQEAFDRGMREGRLLLELPSL